MHVQMIVWPAGRRRFLKLLYGTCGALIWKTVAPFGRDFNTEELKEERKNVCKNITAFPF